MKAFMCVDGRDWEALIRGVARYLMPDEGEATLAHVVDERVPRGYEISLRDLLERRGRGDAKQEMARASREAAEGLLADARDLLQRLRPDVPGIEVTVLGGDPTQELMRAAGEVGARTIFISRGTPGSRPRKTVSGVVRVWNRNHKGEFDGLLLYDGAEIRFPPHKDEAVRAVIREGARVEASGAWQGRHLHAYFITDIQTGSPVEAHEPPDE